MVASLESVVILLKGKIGKLVYQKWSGSLWDMFCIFFFQFPVYARDQRTVNERTATTQILITVDLDEAPRFTSDLSVQQLAETAKAGDLVKQLLAFDADLEVILQLGGPAWHNLNGLTGQEKLNSRKQQLGRPMFMKSSSGYFIIWAAKLESQLSAVCPVKIQISLCTVWSESSLGTF